MLQAFYNSIFNVDSTPKSLSNSTIFIWSLKLNMSCTFVPGTPIYDQAKAPMLDAQGLDLIIYHIPQTLLECV